MIYLASLITILIGVVLLFFSIAFHEMGHAFIADRLGDPTPRSQGRLSFDLRKHIDLVGTVLVPLVLFFIKSPFVFGWAKPVEIDAFNLRNPKRDMALISIAGPSANILLAIISGVFFKITVLPFSSFVLMSNIFLFLTQINVSLAVFNLIPVHPLDGGKILIGFLPARLSRQVELFLARYGFIILLFLIFPIFSHTSILGLIISPIIKALLSILIPGNQVI